MFEATTMKMMVRVHFLHLVLLFSMLLRGSSSFSFPPHPPFCHRRTVRRRRRRPAPLHIQHNLGVPTNRMAADNGERSASTSKEQVENPQTVAVVGSGAVGSYYGSRLWEAGHDVKFYMREPHYSACSKAGLNVTSIDGDVFIPSSKIDVRDSTQKIGVVDWVLVSLKSTSLDAIPDLIYPLLDPDRTRVLVIMNGLVEDDLIRMLKEKAHEETDDSSAQLQCSGLASSRSDDPISDQVAFEDLWRTTSIPTSYDQCLLRGRWKKMLWNLPFNGISVAMGGITIDKVMTDPGLRQLASLIMNETRTAAHADLERVFGANGYEPLKDEDLEYCMTLSDTMGPYKPSTMLDLVNRRKMEVQYLFEKPLERARSLGVPVPHLETVVTQIQAFQRMYDLF